MVMRLSLKSKMMLSHVLIGLMPVSIVGVVSFFNESSEMEQQSFVLFFLLVAGVCVTVAYLVARSIANPLAKIAEVTNEMAGGNLNVEFDVARSDEIGQLSASLKSMQGRLSAVIEQEVQSIVDSAGSGDLSQRIDLAGKDGFYRSL